MQIIARTSQNLSESLRTAQNRSEPRRTSHNFFSCWRIMEKSIFLYFLLKIFKFFRSFFSVPYAFNHRVLADGVKEKTPYSSKIFSFYILKTFCNCEKMFWKRCESIRMGIFYFSNMSKKKTWKKQEKQWKPYKSMKK